MREEFRLLFSHTAVTKRKLFFISIPFILFITAFSYVPLLGWGISFFKYYPGIPVQKLEFIGLRNFEMFFSSGSQVLLVLRNTLALSFFMILSLPVPAVFAILLNELCIRPLKKVVQALSTMPYFISYVLLYVAFVTVLAPSDGMLNILLYERLHLLSQPVSFLSNVDIAWPVQTIVYLFKTMGYSAILYLSAISSIDSELYVAAEIDGADRFQKIIHITLPGISSTFIVLLVLALGNMLSGAGFEQYYVFGSGMVLDKLEVLDTYTYKIGLVQANYSFGTAMSMMKSIVSVILLLISNFIVKRVRGSSIF